MFRIGSSRGRTVGLVAALLVGAVFLARTIGGGGGPADVPAAEDLPIYETGAAADHVGEAAVVCGRVADAAYRPEVGGRPTFLNFGRAYPDQAFTAVIWGEHRGRFDRPEARLRGERVCVRGWIRSHRGTPQIEVSDPGQIRIEAAAESRGPTPSPSRPR